MSRPPVYQHLPRIQIVARPHDAHALPPNHPTFSTNPSLMKTPRKTSPIVEDIERWLAHLQNHGRSPRSLNTYRCAFNRLYQFLLWLKIITSNDIRSDHLTAWSAELAKTGLKASTHNLYIRVIQGWLAWQVETGRLFFSPAETLTRPKQARALGRCPTEAQMRRLLARVSGDSIQSCRDRALLELAYATGARCEELVRFDISSLNLSEGYVLLEGKGGKQRTVPLTTAAIVALKAYLGNARPRLLRGREDQPALFIGQRGGHRVATSAVAFMVKRRGAEVGLKISPHDIRRAFATHLLTGGASVAHLKDLLGHAGYSHLHHYLKQAPGNMFTTVKKSPLNQ